MKLSAAISTAILTLSLAVAIPAYAQQDQHGQEENKDKAVQEKEKKAQPEKAVRQEEKKKPEERKVEPGKIEHNEQHAGRIPVDRFKANFGREHHFRVTESNYRDRRFQYGGYSFGFVQPWPSNWLYTQDVYVVEIDGVYYLCNASYPGVNLTLSVNL
jgi:hypothetical protein